MTKKTMMNKHFSSYSVPDDVELSVQHCVDELIRERFDERIWAHDTSLWRGDTGEMAQRLGWLHLGETMQRDDELAAMRDELTRDGYSDAVLLGMGGSSLGAEVIALTLGQPAGLRVHVLDSTAPEAVAYTRDSVDLARTAFIVSSKSGGTLEPNLLYEYFHALVERTVDSNAGRHFIAITDAGSSLASLAAEAGFRRLFLNPADVGGRYSVLSLFGLVPGAVCGADTGNLRDAGARMATRCRSDSGLNPGTALGAFIAGCARGDRDKLTILTSPSVRSFGWWAEQLVAESTGKEGTGVIPIVDEPPLPSTAYSTDRAFIYVRLAGDDNDLSDAHARAIATAGQPCATIQLAERNELGAEFFRWEYATACAGALLRIDPFNQPNVQSAKDASTAVLEHYMTKGRLPHPGHVSSPRELLDDLPHGSYLAVMGYLRRRSEVDDVLDSFRSRVGQRHGVATSFGYGPRMLHSTGQLYKGGPPTGRFLQIVAGHPSDVALPDRPYTFGVVVDAQALGDLQALRALGRPVARITLEEDNIDQLASALAELE
jgi:glucose-6-phosphate isomerase